MTSGNGQMPAKRRSAHPYRDSGIAYAILGAVVVAIAALTGSTLTRAFAGGGGAFILATAWTWMRLRSRERRR